MTGSGRGSIFRRPTVLTSDLIPSRHTHTQTVLVWRHRRAWYLSKSPSSPSHQPPPGHQATWRVSSIQPGWPLPLLDSSGLDVVVLRPKGPLDLHHMVPHFFSALGTRNEATNAPPLGILAQISFQKRTHKRKFSHLRRRRSYPVPIGLGEVVGCPGPEPE